jgi:hypothetical protein
MILLVVTERWDEMVLGVLWKWSRLWRGHMKGEPYYCTEGNGNLTLL